VTAIDGTVAQVWVRQPMMYCRVCMGEYSGNPADYLAVMGGDTELRCCKTLMMLVDKRIVYSEVTL
jgi:hypothetical protein